MRAFLAFIGTLLGVGALALYSSAFIVHQTEQAIVLRFGTTMQVITRPGLHWKVPFVDNVIYYDNRVLDLDTSEREVTAADQQRLIVDAFARYRVTNPLSFYQTLKSVDDVPRLVGPIIEDEIRSALNSASLSQVVNDKRDELMRLIVEKVNATCKNRDFGIQIVDVRIKRADLPQENLVKVFDRMKADRVREATELRAQGEAENNRIRADADRQVTILKANATRDADKIRGDGEGERNRIFAEAFGRDPDFFRFYRSMQAYEQAMKPGDTRLLLSPDSEFFRYFQDPQGAAPNTQRSSTPPAPR